MKLIKQIALTSPGNNRRCSFLQKERLQFGELA